MSVLEIDLDKLDVNTRYIKLFNDDCFNVLGQIPDKIVSLVCIDPPYLISKPSNFDKGGAWNNATDARLKKTPPKSDFGDWDKKSIDFAALFKEFYRVLKQGGSVVCFFDIWKIQELRSAAEEAGFRQFRVGRWDKTNPVPVNSKLNYLTNATEYFISMVKGNNPTFNSEYDNGVYVYPICGGDERTYHPTQKPLGLMEELIKKHSNANDLVLDCYMGSGTTGVACINNGRHFIGVEIDKGYFSVAKQRLIESEHNNFVESVDKIVKDEADDMVLTIPSAGEVL